MTGLFRNFSRPSIIENDESSFNTVYKFIKNNQFISFYRNGKKYFFFIAGGRIYYLSEMTLGFIIFTFAFFGTVAVRKLFKKYKLSKKIKKKLGKLLKTIRFRGSLGVRGGGSFEDDILHYEVEVDNNGKSYIPTLPYNLNAQELLVKAIIKKCLQPNHYYRITNRGLLEIIEKMMQFGKNDSVRIISYDVLILALRAVTKPMSIILYEGTSRAVEKLGYSTVVKYSPLIASLLIGIASGVGVNLALQGSNLWVSFLSAIPGWAGSFRIAEYTRNVLAIDCSDYVEKLPVRESKSLPYGEPLEQEICDNSKISVSPSKPTRHETFISTAPGQDLYYEEKREIEVETLEGVYKESRKVNGEKIVIWKSNRQPKKHIVTESEYIRLKDRTRTLADVRDLDSTVDRESADRIRERIQKEQIQYKIIEDFLE